MLIIFLPKIIFNPCWCWFSSECIPEVKIRRQKGLLASGRGGRGNHGHRKMPPVMTQWELQGLQSVPSDAGPSSQHNLECRAGEWERSTTFQWLLLSKSILRCTRDCRTSLFLEGNLSVSASEGKVLQYAVVHRCRGCPPVIVCHPGVFGAGTGVLVPVP